MCVLDVHIRIVRFVEETQGEDREGACVLSWEVEFQRKIAEVVVGVHDVDKPQLTGQTGETIAEVEDVAGVAFLGQRTFGGDFFGHGTYLNEMLVFRTVAVAHLNIKHTAERIVIVGIEGGSEEIGIADDIRVQCTYHAVACIV